MRPPPSAALAFLEQVGAATRRHLAGRTLLDHLRSTYELLAGWQAPEEIALAGLFHSIYGTQAFDHLPCPPTGNPGKLFAPLSVKLLSAFPTAFAPWNGRPSWKIQRRRFLADRFDGNSLPVQPADLAALCEILFANVIDLAIAKKGPDPSRILAKTKTLAHRLLPHLPDRAVSAWRQLTGLESDEFESNA